VKSILVILFIVVAALLVVAIGAGLIVLVATGLGAVLSGLLPFSAFEATLFSLIAILGVAVLIGQIVAAIARFQATAEPVRSAAPDDEEDEEEWEDENEEDNEDWDEDEEEAPGESGFIPSIPRWRQPIKRARFENVGRNDPCPCGSGREFKNCHGKPGA